MHGEDLRYYVPLGRMELSLEDTDQRTDSMFDDNDQMLTHDGSCSPYIRPHSTMIEIEIIGWRVRMTGMEVSGEMKRV